MDELAAQSFPLSAGVLFGLGLGGFFDGIVLHQILQWHHMLTSAGYPPTTSERTCLNSLPICPRLTSNLGGSRILSVPVELLALTKQPTLFAALVAARLQPASTLRIGETSRISGTLFSSAPLGGGMLRTGRDVSSS